MKDIGILKLLCETPGVTGHEKDISFIVKNIFEKFCNEVKVDDHYNVIGVMKAKLKDNGSAPGERALRLLYTAHIDEIGMMVSEISTGGFIKIAKVAGVDPKTLVAKKVVIHTATGNIKGIVASIPPHLTAAEERKNALMFEDLYVDTGLSEETVKERISVGDVVSYAPSFETQGVHMASGKSLDDRAGIFTLIKTMQILKERTFSYDILFLAAVSEELDSLGTMAGTWKLEPDLCVAIDVTHGKAGIGEQSEFHQLQMLGKGPVVCRSPILSHRLTKGIIDICKEKGWKPQLEVDNRDTGTDAFAASVARQGCATALVSLPLKYMHTQVEMVHLEDIEATAEVLAELAMQSSMQIRGYL